MSGEHPIVTAMAQPSARELASLLAEPGFLGALQHSYHGRHAIADAIHWRLEPLSLGPTHLPDPAIDLAWLKARVYSGRDASERTIPMTDDRGAAILVTVNEARLLRLEQQLRVDADDLDRAIGRAIEIHRSSEPGERIAREPVREPGVQRVLRRHPALILATAAALLVLAFVPATFEAIRPDLTPSAALLKVFNRPQSIGDIAPQAFTGGQPAHRQAVRDTMRLLGRFYGIQVYAFHDLEGQVCLLTSAPQERDISVCVSTQTFSAKGVTVLPAHYGVVDAAAGVSSSTRLEFRWGPDAELSVRALD